MIDFPKKSSKNPENRRFWRGGLAENTRRIPKWPKILKIDHFFGKSIIFSDF